jgi:hypothetical protein
MADSKGQCSRTHSKKNRVEPRSPPGGRCITAFDCADGKEHGGGRNDTYGNLSRCEKVSDKWNKAK